MATTPNVNLPLIDRSATADVPRDVNALAVAVDTAFSEINTAIPDGSITPTKLSFDPATQAELDAHIADYVRQPGYAVTTGAANTYAAALLPALSAYIAGVCIAVKINVANTGASTLNVNGLGAKAILDSKGNAMTAGKLKIDSIYTLRYNGTAFILQGEGGGGNAKAAELLAGKTATVDSGDIVGTMVNKTGIVKNLRTLNDATLVKGAGIDSFSYTSPADQSILTVIPEEGYYDGVTSKLAIGIWGLNPDIVKAGHVFGWVNGGFVGTYVGDRQEANGGIMSGAGGLITVTGVPFIPSIVIVRAQADAGVTGNFAIYVAKGKWDHLSDLSMYSRDGSSNNIGSFAHIAGGFNIQVSRGNAAYYWLALS